MLVFSSHPCGEEEHGKNGAAGITKNNPRHDYSRRGPVLFFFLKDGTGGLDDQDGSSVYDVDTPR